MFCFYLSNSFTEIVNLFHLDESENIRNYFFFFQGYTFLISLASKRVRTVT